MHESVKSVEEHLENRGKKLMSKKPGTPIPTGGDEDGKIIISDSTLRSLLPPQLKKCLHVIRLCVVVNVVFLLIVYIHHCYPGVIGI